MKTELEQATIRAVKSVFDVNEVVELVTTEEQFGDYATNVALKLANQLQHGPREVAETLAGSLRQELGERVSEITVADPGFINFKLSDQALIQMLQVKSTKSLAGQIIVIEYSDPNPFKPLHAGHLYTTLVGDTIARLVDNAGAKTIRINYGGDVGLHVGKTLWAIVKALDGEFPDKLNEIGKNERANWLGKRYVEGNAAYNDNEQARTEIIETNKRVYALHAGNDHESAFAQLYWTSREWSYDYFHEFYERLQVVPFDRFIAESEVTPLGIETVNQQLEKGVYAKSQGAVVFEGEKFGLHTRVFINSEGLPTYEAKETGLSLTKWQDYNFDESIIITAHEQAEYMRVVLASLKQFAPEPAERTKHLTHGVVKLSGGVKMSSREGNVITAVQILEAAREAGNQNGTNPSDDVILAAVKYGLVKNRIGGDIIYDPVESIALEGNSGPYLQYAHARAKSILSKSTATAINDQELGSSDLQPSERSLTRKLTEFSEVVDRATNELMPHHICTYLYELAQVFNRFYESNQVIGQEREPLRIYLVNHYAETLKTGLNLLGMSAPESM